MLFAKSYPADSANSDHQVIILHGLFGSHANWGAIARSLASAGYTVHTPDLRNHGRSFHDPVHTPAAMADDVFQWMASLPTGRPIIVGHSMGGIVALTAALLRPEAFAGLVMVDIAPKLYTPHHQKEFQALRTDMSGVADRATAESMLEELLPNPEVRSFILTNLQKKDNGFEWRINVEALARQFDSGEVKPELPANTFTKPALCVYGGQSNYVRPEDKDRLVEMCPAMEFVEIDDAGHWLHYSHADAFLGRLQAFLSGL